MNVSKKREQEKQTLSLMIEIYCKGNHKTLDGLCEECQRLKDYAMLRTDKCPFMETKTFCSACKVHCYAPEQKEKIREVMRYSGPRMMLYHPGAALHHMCITIKKMLPAKRWILGIITVICCAVLFGLKFTGGIGHALASLCLIVMSVIHVKNNKERFKHVPGNLRIVDDVMIMSLFGTIVTGILLHPLKDIVLFKLTHKLFAVMFVIGCIAHVLQHKSVRKEKSCFTND